MVQQETGGGVVWGCRECSRHACIGIDSRFRPTIHLQVQRDDHTKITEYRGLHVHLPSWNVLAYDSEWRHT